MIVTQGFRPQDEEQIDEAILQRSEWFWLKIGKNDALFFEGRIKQATNHLNEV